MGGLLAATAILTGCATHCCHRSAMTCHKGAKFFGTASDGRVHLLGRGGSDLSAVFLAHRLGAANCRLVKDVDGIYDVDPARSRECTPRRYSTLSHEDALRVAGRLIQPKSVSYLQENGSSADVAAQALPYQSRVHQGPTQLGVAGTARPLRVVILGLGTVGFGVYQRLAANPAHFQVEAILVRHPQKYQALGVAVDLLFTNSEHVRRLTPDIVIDALPPINVSKHLVEHFLSKGADVVSANKTLIADHGDELVAVAALSGATLRYSASVGGSAPMIETVRRAAASGPLAKMAAILNGTCNFVLDSCADGASLEDALTEAKRRGFAEDNPTEDLSGRDAERKLRILAKHAFGAAPKHIETHPLDESIAREARNAAVGGLRLRQISRAWAEGDRVAGCVRFERIDKDGTFGRLTQERNGLEILRSDGQQFLTTGRGAGRWPTTESLMADAFDVRRARWPRHVDADCKISA